VHGLVEQQQF
jgi:hypothetical protein